MTKSKQTRFPRSLFLIYFLVLLLMSGLHTQLIVFINSRNLPPFLSVNLPIVYWLLIALGLTWFTRQRIKKTYDEPITNLSEAAEKVAAGDFSVYVKPTHPVETGDYLDALIKSFNTMVEELGSIETLKTDFFSNVSHEFKTPLAVISNNAALLKNSVSGEEAEYVENILSSTKSLSSLISNMLKLNKLEKQTITSAGEDYDLTEQLCAAALCFESQWEAKNITFNAEFEHSLLIHADKELFNLGWMNLLSNAVKVTGDGGTITLAEKSEGDEVVVSVYDDGAVMTEEQIKHCFDKFYQGDSSHKEEGNGLGLAIVKRIIELEGGEITAESSEGKGTTFTVRMRKDEKRI